MKKGHLVEQALRHHLQALQELPGDVIVHSKLVAVYAPTCPPKRTLLLWHAGSSDTAAVPADPDLERRLRAIGYLQ